MVALDWVSQWMILAKWEEDVQLDSICFFSIDSL